MLDRILTGFCLRLLVVGGTAVGMFAFGAAAEDRLTQPWPEPSAVAHIRGDAVSFPSRSPFGPNDLVDGDGLDATAAKATLFMPPGRHAPRTLPAVVMLHGSGGVLSNREMTYAPQLASMGVAALVIDAFAARRDRATGFIDRLLNITETMLIADAYAALRYLAAKPEIDPDRVVLLGFSYGAMATMYALNARVAEMLAPDGLRFAGHVAFYGPCIARFEEPRTTGAPLLILYGAGDELIDRRRCAEIVGDFRAGGSEVEIIVYPGAVHQWDGGFHRRLIGRNLSDCSFEVETDGTVRDLRTGLPMWNPFWRRVILGLCVTDRPYPIGRDDAVRAKSNADLGRFLARVFSNEE
jgi:dienelactone hydrolase